MASTNWLEWGAQTRRTASSTGILETLGIVTSTKESNQSESQREEIRTILEDWREMYTFEEDSSTNSIDNLDKTFYDGLILAWPEGNDQEDNRCDS